MKEVKNTVESICSRVEQMEDRINDLDDRNCGTTQLQEKKEKRIKMSKPPFDLWDSAKRTNYRIINIPEGEKREEATEILFKKLIAENFPKLGKDLDI